MTQDGAKFSVRIDFPGGSRLGPGKAALMEAILEHGSLSGAARSLGMSYPRALKLMESLNAIFEGPVVETFQGGASRGGARLTPLGEKVLHHYKTAVANAHSAAEISLADLASLRKTDAKP